jgi:glycosyltransferase involved in cell wall biosynthesis
MTSKRCLISICIPTRNRAENLRETLDTIVSQSGFEEYCEVIISDNASLDNTEEVVARIASTHKNIHYVRNVKDLGADENFFKVVGLARGEYVELLGDKVCMLPGVLKKIIAILEPRDIDAICVLNGSMPSMIGVSANCTNLSDFVGAASFRSTWMSGIIFRREIYLAVVDSRRSMGSQLIQTDWMFQIAASSGRVLVIGEIFFREQSLVNPSKGYNIFSVFVNNYLTILRRYVKDGSLKKSTFEVERRSLLRGFVFPWYTRLAILRSGEFDLGGANALIVKEYWRCATLYSYPFYLISFACSIIARRIARMIEGHERE